MMVSAYQMVGVQEDPYSSTGQDLAAETIQFLLEILIEQVRATATPDQTHGFFVATGRRMAALAQLGSLSQVEDIEVTLNTVWRRMGLGEVAFELDDHGLDIVHVGLPAIQDGGANNAIAEALPAMLEGAYGAWLESLSETGAALRTWIVAHSGDRLELRHAP